MSTTCKDCGNKYKGNKCPLCIWKNFRVKSEKKKPPTSTQDIEISNLRDRLEEKNIEINDLRDRLKKRDTNVEQASTVVKLMRNRQEALKSKLDLSNEELNNEIELRKHREQRLIEEIESRRHMENLLTVTNEKCERLKNVIECQEYLEKKLSDENKRRLYVEDLITAANEEIERLKKVVTVANEERERSENVVKKAEVHARIVIQKYENINKDNVLLKSIIKDKNELYQGIETNYKMTKYEIQRLDEENASLKNRLFHLLVSHYSK